MGNRVAKLRESLGLTQAQFSKGLTTSRTHVASIETGARAPGRLLLREIAERYGANEEWLLSGKGEMKASPAAAREIPGARLGEQLPEDALRLAWRYAQAKPADRELVAGVAARALPDAEPPAELADYRNPRLSTPRAPTFVRVNMVAEAEARYGRVRLPVVGIVSAGQPVEIIEGREPLEWIEWTDLTRTDIDLVLRVHGESMRGEGILSGDWVLCTSRAPEKGEVAIVELLPEYETTMKRWVPKPKDGTVELHPANEDVAVIVRPLETVKAIGVVRTLVRRMPAKGGG